MSNAIQVTLEHFAETSSNARFIRTGEYSGVLDGTIVSVGTIVSGNSGVIAPKSEEVAEPEAVESVSEPEAPQEAAEPAQEEAPHDEQPTA